MSSLILIGVFANRHSFAGDDHAGGDHKEEKEHGHEKEGGNLAELNDEKVKHLGVPVIKAESGPIDSYLVIFGKIDLHPEKAQHLHSKYPGVVRDVYKSIGDRVRVGDVLARVENNVGVQSSDLVSTISGIILEKNISAGQSVNEEVEAFTVADLSLVMATLVAYPRDINRLSIGQKVLLQTTKTGHSETAEISYISPLLDDKTRTAKIQIYLKNEAGLWRPGQFVIGKIQVGKRNAMVRIANDVVISSGNIATKIYVKDGNRFVQRVVSVADGDSSYAEITSGLAEGEEYLGMSIEQIEDIYKKKAVDADAKK
jgi:multidrug efflux pump subunit AcrA (membrane-fusion protein)